MRWSLSSSGGEAEGLVYEQAEQGGASLPSSMSRHGHDGLICEQGLAGGAHRCSSAMGGTGHGVGSICDERHDIGVVCDGRHGGGPPMRLGGGAIHDGRCGSGAPLRRGA
jgi:hypothetical protein